MVFLLLGAGSLIVLMAALGMFSRAQITSIKAFGVWVAAIGGLLLATMLVLTGRGGTAIAALLMLGPMVWSWMQPKRGAPKQARRPAGSAANLGMSRAEAFAVLGLQADASAEAIRAAHLRLMRMAHPDAGGSDWLAKRINQARDVLLG